MKRKYNFDKIEEIGYILDMDLEWNGTAYVDRFSGEELVECDQYFDWQIIQLLDEMPDDIVKDVIM